MLWLRASTTSGAPRAPTSFSSASSATTEVRWTMSAIESLCLCLQRVRTDNLRMIISFELVEFITLFIASESTVSVDYRHLKWLVLKIWIFISFWRMPNSLLLKLCKQQGPIMLVYYYYYLLLFRPNYGYFSWILTFNTYYFIYCYTTHSALCSIFVSIANYLISCILHWKRI
jgi:hypothetical protein